jgi:hypothetical protein
MIASTTFHFMIPPLRSRCKKKFLATARMRYPMSMVRPGNLLTAILVLATACGADKEEVNCVKVCERALACLVEGVEQGGDSAVQVKADEANIMAACTTKCGGTWEMATSDEACAPDLSCAELANCFADSEVSPLIPSDGEQSQPFWWQPESQCIAKVRGVEGCREVPSEDLRWECLVVAACAKALRSGDISHCGGLGIPWSDLCEALGERNLNKCPAVDSGLRNGCVQFIEGNPDGSYGHLFTAIAVAQPQLCQPLKDPLERKRCEAMSALDVASCPRELVVEDGWGELVGAAFRRHSRSQEIPQAPLFIPYLYALLGALAILLWPWLLVWCHDLVGRLRQLGGGGGGLLCVALLVYVVARLLAVEGPINFVEYERVFVPGTDDLGRLGYAGWSLVARPLLAVFGGGYRLLFVTSALFGVIAILAVTSLAMQLSGKGGVAGLAALLLAVQPAFVRVAASASETLPSAALTIVFFDLLMRWGQLPRRLTLGVGLVLAPLLLVFRPEGLFLGIPAVAALLATPAGPMSLVRSWTPTQRAVALWVAGLFVSAGVLFASLPRPPMAWGLFFSNLQSVLTDIALPWFLSPAMTVGGLVAACWLLRAASHRSFGLAVWLWTLLLVAGWGVQGSEDNLALGSTRYVVLWLPWLAISLSLGIGALRGKQKKWAAGICVLVSLLQIGLVTSRTNLQLEYDFYVRVLPKVPSGSLLVLPASPKDNQEFSPEAAPLAILAMLRHSARWMSVDEALAMPQQLPKAFFLRGFYGHEDSLARLRPICRVKAVETESLVSVPDVGPHAEVVAGETAVLGLYEMECKSF